MKITAKRIRIIKNALWIIAGYLFIAVLFTLNIHAVRYTYSYAQYNAELQQYVVYPFSVGESLKRSMPIGLLLGIITAVIELTILPSVVRRMHFLTALVIRIVGYIIITIPVVYYSLVIEEMYLRQLSYSALNNDPGFNLIGPRLVQLVTVASTISALSISFIRLVGKKFGRGVLLQYVFGKYHKPRDEERIFMFLDLRSSTSIAEQLNHKQYHNFLNDIFYDISEPILEYRGEIYQYVGDEVVITWPIETGIEQERCVRCFFAINALLERRNPVYMKKYGVEAKMKAGIHCGMVTTGEIGDLKTEIVYHGDIVNTTSRIQEMCNKLRATLLVSGELLHRCRLNNDKFIIEGGGTLKLRGKEKVIEVYSLIRKTS
jgi:adenylate cyclase